MASQALARAARASGPISLGISTMAGASPAAAMERGWAAEAMSSRVGPESAMRMGQPSGAGLASWAKTAWSGSSSEREKGLKAAVWRPLWLEMCARARAAAVLPAPGRSEAIIRRDMELS